MFHTLTPIDTADGAKFWAAYDLSAAFNMTPYHVIELLTPLMHA